MLFCKLKIKKINNSPVLFLKEILMDFINISHVFHVKITVLGIFLGKP